MRDWTLNIFTARVASRTPTPGGGSVSALSGALAASLGAMVAGFSGDAETALKFDSCRDRFLDLIKEDSDGYDAVSAVMKTPKGEAGRSEKMQAALMKAARPPAEGLELIADLAKLLEAFTPKSKGSVSSDLAVAAFQAEAAARGFYLNVKANTGSLKDKPAAAKLDSEAKALLDATLSAAGKVRKTLGE